MVSLIYFFFLQALFPRILDANIEIFTKGNVVECGQKFTLTCKIEKGKTVLAWMFDDDIVPIARCLSKSCDITKDYVGKYQLDYNVNEGFYNLTIRKLTIAEIGRTFVCSTGYESVSKTILFKDYRALLFEDAENGIITASSGFISPDTKIVMKWTKIDADDSNESDFHPQLLYTTANMYSNVCLCSTNKLMQHSVAFSAEPSDSGKHYLKLAVTYGNETVISNITTLKYNVEDQGANIEILTKGKVIECGQTFTLTCKVTNGKTLLSWMSDDDIVPIVRCLSKSCDITTDYVGKYQLDYNVNEGFYNLTIMKLTIAEIGRTFVCSTGYESVSKTILFKDYMALLFEDAENDIITASSGFISPDTKIVMKWTKIDADDSNESDFHPQLLYTTANMYSNVSLCSTNQLMQHSMTISAEPSDSGKHYLKFSVTYGNETIVSNITTLKYNIEDQVSPTDNLQYTETQRYFNNGNSLDDEKTYKTIVFIISAVLVVLCGVLFVTCRNRSLPVDGFSWKQKFKEYAKKNIRRALNRTAVKTTEIELESDHGIEGHTDIEFESDHENEALVANESRSVKLEEFWNWSESVNDFQNRLTK